VPSLPSDEPPVEPRALAPSEPARKASREAASPSKDAKVRVAHPQQGSTDCVEMAGTCSAGPNPICTSRAVVVECGKTVLPEGGREWLRCVCP
jgi:hypothetical protein